MWGVSSGRLRVSVPAACLLSLVTALGCGAQRVKMYQGPERPASETATVSGYFDRDSMMVTIASVDTIPVPGQRFRGSFYNRDTTAVIEPGPRLIGIRFWGLVGTITVESRQRIEVKFDAEAGRHYEVRVARDPGMGVAHPETLRRVMIPGMGSRPWIVWVIDLETAQRIPLLEESGAQSR